MLVPTNACSAATVAKIRSTMAKLMLNWLWRLNRTRRLVRWPIKCLIVALTLLWVCFPNPARLAEHLSHWRNPNALIEPDAPALTPLVAALRPKLEGVSDPQETFRIVEKFVRKEIPYDWDWNTWGCADYLPTVTEVIEKGREDCDGQAVIAASLLRHFGFHTQLVANFAHMWVRTDRGEFMGPGKNKAVVATREGPKFRLRGLLELPKSTAFGVAVFPLMRELIVLGVLGLMLVDRNRRAISQGFRLAIMTAALIALRYASVDYRQQILWLQALAVVAIVACIVVQTRRPTCEISSSTSSTERPPNAT